ncbi:MAG: deoxyribose-phosphate aldolase [Verrucomicrobiota bacterium]
MDTKKFASYLDATNLKLDSTDAELCSLCDEAAQAGCASVCVYPTNVSLCSNVLYDSPTKVCTVIGFPHGRSTTASKREEIIQAKENGADEVDIVLNYAALRTGERGIVANQVEQLCNTARELNLLTKIIVETCFLNKDQKIDSLAICEAAGADFIKTSTGFGKGGATVADVALFAQKRSNGIKIKASGGIKTVADALAIIEAGAERLGVSAAAALLAELEGKTIRAVANESDNY